LEGEIKRINKENNKILIQLEKELKSKEIKIKNFEKQLKEKTGIIESKEKQHKNLTDILHTRVNKLKEDYE